MYTSPTEFKYRNLFVDENFLVRDFTRFGNLKISAVTPEYLLATKLLAPRIVGQDYSDIKFLLRALGINSVAGAEAVIERFFPRERVLPKTMYVIENALGEMDA